nr:hypothetical protein [Sporolactobacillus pectinivorans]
MSESREIEYFVDQLIEHSDYEETDRRYLINRVLALVGEGESKAPVSDRTELVELKDNLVAFAVRNHRIDDNQSSRDRLGAQLMDLVTPPPSVVNRIFWKKYVSHGPLEATDYFYRLCRLNDYIKTKAIRKNIYFRSPAEYGDLEITINLSKPEKDPKKIALAKKCRTPDTRFVSYVWKMKVILDGPITLHEATIELSASN